MSRVFLTGDVHGDFRRFGTEFFAEGKFLTKDDVVIILGDTAILWDPIDNISDKEKHWTKWLANKPFTTLFLAGNHENHDRLDNLRTSFGYGSEIGVVTDSIYHLRNGNVYTINNKKFFVMGGAVSIDQASRIEGLSWWRQEVPSIGDWYDANNNLLDNNNKVDYILTHTMPIRKLVEFNNMIGGYVGDPKLKDPTCDGLQTIYETVEFKKWFCGHFHRSLKLDDIQVLYTDIIELD